MELSRNKKSFGLGVLFGAISIALFLSTGVSILTAPYTLSVGAFILLGDSSDLLVYWTSDSSFPHPTVWSFVFGFIPALLIYGCLGWIVGKLYYRFKSKFFK